MPARCRGPRRSSIRSARGLDVIGDRWTLVLVRHLLGARRGFQELRKRTGIAPRVLSARLRQLAADGLRRVRRATARARSTR